LAPDDTAAAATERPLRRLILALPIIVAALAGCGSDSDPIDAEGGLVVIGHSHLTGANSDPARPGADARENSWATGTSPSIRSIYQRLIETQPQFDGLVANAAVDGAPASALASQARTALREVPHPRLVIIQIIDNDIRCDGTDADHVAEFGADVTAALAVVTEASPASQILVVSKMGRPATYAAAISSVPEAVQLRSGTGPCSLFDEAGRLNAEAVANLTAIVEGYEAELFRVCGEVSHCANDGGAMAAFVDRAVDLSSDWHHLAASGHARLAETMWPTVADLLGLDPG
jgi:hypothetical protein